MAISFLAILTLPVQFLGLPFLRAMYLEHILKILKVQPLRSDSMSDED